MLRYKPDIPPAFHVRERPFESAFQIIDRRTLTSSDASGEASGEDSRDMPVWKKGYKQETEEKSDPVVSEISAEKVKFASVLELIYFIRMIQKGNQ
ncbi:hypothetical protein [Neptunomonas sp.]|uniref:hypothetical protein n=1 Tax=Neptunomonas sp. TaxID=1971898 RepID=UPI00356B4A1D